MMQTVLDKSRVLSNVIQEGTGGRSDLFSEMTRALSQLTKSSVYVIGKKGQLRACSLQSGVDPIYYEKNEKSGTKQVDKKDFEWIWSFNRVEINYHTSDGFCMTIMPVFARGERLAVWVFAKEEDDFSAEDLVLFEFASAVSGLELSRQNSERIEQEVRRKAAVELAIEVLSYSELEAVKTIFENFDKDEGFVVASKLAEEHNLTRSVIVNALRKLESAGVIDSRSLGVKGTYIRILNEYFLDRLTAGTVRN